MASQHSSPAARMNRASTSAASVGVAPEVRATFDRVDVSLAVVRFELIPGESQGHSHQYITMFSLV